MDKKELESANLKLVKRYKNRGGSEILAQIIKLNEPYIYGVSKKFTPFGVSGEDLYQAGVEGVLKAIRSFDATREDANATAAIRQWIKAVIYKQYEDLTQQVHVGGRTERRVKSGYTKAYYALKRELGREPTDQEIAKKLGVSAAELSKIKSVNTFSGNKPVISKDGNEEEEFFNLIGYKDQEDPEELTYLKSLEQKIKDIVFDYYEQTQNARSAKYLLGILNIITGEQSSSEVAREMGVSRQAISLQLKNVRTALADSELGRELLDLNPSFT